MDPEEPNELKKLNHSSRYMVEFSKWNEIGTTGAVPVTIKEQS